MKRRKTRSSGGADEEDEGAKEVVVVEKKARSTPTTTALATIPSPSSSNAATGPRLSVHRCRFMGWEPAAVVAMAASRSGHLLAVARDNGVVEVRLTREKFRVIATIEVAVEGIIQSLAWSRHAADKSARLFVGGIDGSVAEVDVWRLQVKSRDSYGGAVWCVSAAHFRDTLAVACEDGTVKFFSTADGDLEYSRSLPSIHTRAVSLAWQHDDGGIFVGGADGTIRHFDAVTGQSTYRMTVESRGSINPPIVWCLKALSDGTVVSGDSLGNVHIWDGHMGTLEQTFSLHEAAVLTLDVAPTNDFIFASGVDSKLACLKRKLLPPSGGGGGGSGATSSSSRWVLAASNRAHSHDVLALAIVEHESRSGQLGHVLVSAGKDTKICSYSVPDFATTRPRYIAPYPYHTVGHVANNRIVLIRHDRKLHLWRLNKDPTHYLQDPLPDVEIPSFGNGYITACAITIDGKYFSYATAKDIRVYRLIGDDGVTPTKHPSPVQGMKGVTSLAFSTDSTRLVLGFGHGGVAVVDLKSGALVETDDDGDGGDDEGDSAAVTSLSCSADGRLLAVARINGNVEVRALPSPSSPSPLRRLWHLRKLDSSPTVVSYHTSAPDTLVVACVSNRFYLFNREGELKDWSKDLGHRIPDSILDRADCIVGITFNTAAPNTLIFHGFGFMCYVDLDKPHHSLARILPESHPMAVQQGREVVKQGKARERRALLGSSKRHGKDGGGGGSAAMALESEAARGGGEEDEDQMVVVVQDGGGGDGAGGKKKRKGRKREPSPSPADEQAGVEEEEATAITTMDSSSRRRQQWNFLLHLGYQGIITVASVGSGNEIVVIEEPWIKVVSRLPEVLYRQRYGT